MVHTYEVLVDIQEYAELSNKRSRIETARYEVDAETTRKAHHTAWDHAKVDYPKATEYDVRVTRMLK
ncbi:MAG TPA: hypothetical protein V6D10_02290 [Trichocoleus sp.]|jgi:hypothetical protein